MQLVVLRGPAPGQRFELQEGENTVGRAADNAIQLPTPSVSSHHCVFLLRGRELRVRDLGSTNGTWVEGQRVQELALPPGSRVQVGDWLLQVEEPALRAEPPGVPGQPAAGGAFGGFGAPPGAGGAPQGFGAGGSALAFGEQAGAGEAPQGFGAPAEAAPAAGFGAGEAEVPAFGGFGQAQPGQAAPSEPAPSPGSPEQAAYPEPVPPPGGGFGGFGATGGGGFGLAVEPASLEEPESEEPPGEALEVGRQQDWVSRLRAGWARARRFPWKFRLAALLALASLAVLLAPWGGSLALLLRARDVAEQQALERGKALALALAVRNISAIAEQTSLRMETSFILNERGVKDAFITDARGVVRAPPEKGRQSIAGKPYFQEANELGQPTAWEAGGGRWMILSPIRIRVTEGAPLSIAGWAVIEYDLGEVAGDAAPVFVRLVLVVLVLGLASAGVWLGVWRLAAVPVRQLREEVELALRGHVKTVKVEVEWARLKELAHSIDRLLQRWRAAEAGGGTAGQAKVELAPLESFVEGLLVPAFLLDSSGKVLRASAATAQWLGTSTEGLLGQQLAAVLPDPAFVDQLGKVLQRAAQGWSGSETAHLGDNAARLHALRTGTSLYLLVSIG